MSEEERTTPRFPSWTRALGEALAGGAIGLAAAGAGEALLITLAGGLGAREGVGLVAFAAGLHGLLGAMAGLGLGLVLLVLFRKGSGRLTRFTLLPGGHAALVTFLAADLGCSVLGTFRLLRDGGLALPLAAGAALFGSTVFALVLALVVRAVARRLPLGAASVGIFALFFVLGRASLAKAPAPALDADGQASTARPNVILVVVDTLRADSTGPWGGVVDGHSLTPALDAFAAEAVKVEHFHANAAWTRPSVSSILTGQQPGRHGVRHKVDPLPSHGPNLALAFAEGGYATAAAVTNVNLAPDFGFERGFAAYRYHAPSRPLGARGPAQRLSAVNIARLLQERLSSALVIDRFYAAGPTITASALELADRLGDGPFFLWVHYMDPHDPYVKRPIDGSGVARVRDPSPPLAQAEAMRALYQGEVRFFDAAFGELIDGLRERGLMENTVIAVTADHGEEFGEHGGFWHGQTLFEEQTRVPLLVRRPGGEGAGSTLALPAAQIDVAPTLLALAGLEVPEAMDGRPIFATGEGADRIDPAPRPTLIEEDHDGAKLTGFVWQGLKLVRANADNPRGLPEVAVYDLQTDPAERTPLPPDDPRVAELSALLDAHLAGAPPPVFDDAPVEVDGALEEDLRALGYVQ